MQSREIKLEVVALNSINEFKKFYYSIVFLNIDSEKTLLEQLLSDLYRTIVHHHDVNWSIASFTLVNNNHGSVEVLMQNDQEKTITIIEKSYWSRGITIKKHPFSSIYNRKD